MKIVDDQTFVIGLCELFREEMKRYEVTQLLPLAESVCEALGLAPLEVPIEGYYTESAELERYFRLIRRLQNTETCEISLASAKEALFQLREVFASPAMGRVEKNDQLLFRTSSPLGEALRTSPIWSVEGLSQQTAQLVKKDDAGLIAVAAFACNPVALCIARESMALISDIDTMEVETPEFIWEVSESVAEIAKRFISALEKTTGIVLPEPTALSAFQYGWAARDAMPVGRCILIGEQLNGSFPYYHWYIDSNEGGLMVKDFWASHIWTTADIRNMHYNKRPAAGSKVEMPQLEDNQERQGWLARLFQVLHL